MPGDWYTEDKHNKLKKHSENMVRLKYLETTITDKNYSKSKSKVVPVLFFTEHHAMKEYWGSRGIALLIL
jgi:hypothetical protein